MQSIRRLWQSVIQRYFGKPYSTSYVIELPEQLQAKVVYVTGEDDYTFYVVMICPCGCGEILFMNTVVGADPCWRLTQHSDGTVSLDPSVMRWIGCKSHFFLRAGRIIWCRRRRSCGYR